MNLNMLFKSRRYYILLEMIISMGLAMGLLAAALYFYRYASQSDFEMKKLEEKTFQSRMLQSRLSNVFSRLKGPRFFTVVEEPGISIGHSLIFNFSSDSRSQFYHGQAIARLFLDVHHRLVLAVWGDNKMTQTTEERPMHLEVLMENAELLFFEFLVGEDSPYSSEKAGVSIPDWQAQMDLPHVKPRAVKLILKPKGEERLIWAFPIPECG